MALKGSDLLVLVQQKLGGYGNAFDADSLMAFLNDAKDQVWMVLKTLNEDYFMQSSQATDNAETNYFGPLTTSAREFTLPSDLREMRFIEVLAPAGFEYIIFMYRPISHPDFLVARRSANFNRAATALTTYIYTLTGKDQLVLAQYPEQPFTLKLWYIRSLPDFETADPVDEILEPYTKQIASYAAKLAMLTIADQPQFEEWSKEWRQQLITMTEAASPRETADAVFVQDFLG